MEQSELRRELIRASNRDPYNLTAQEVSELLDWFENLPGEIFNELLHSGVDFPGGYIHFWVDMERDREETT